MSIKLTAYQVQAKRRIKKALNKRAVADRRARAYATKLAAALVDASEAISHISTINSLYGTSYSGMTQLVDELRIKDVDTRVGNALAASVAGLPSEAYAVVADANGGAVLAADASID